MLMAPNRILAGLLALLVALAVTAAGAATTAAKPHAPGTHKRPLDGVFERHVSKKNKKWAKRVAACESGGNPNAIGGGGTYRGAFQFMRSTWRTSPRSPGGDPIDYSYKTQAFVAVRLKMRSGSSPWPSCG
ncbi:MAG: transglycosylase family protein [Solirubrobacterales bacterium]